MGHFREVMHLIHIKRGLPGAYSHFFGLMLSYPDRKKFGWECDKMTYSNNLRIDATLVANVFLDKYMPGANGDYVKVYLYLLRKGRKGAELADIAEALELTEGDVSRAIRYWENLGVFRSEPREGEGGAGEKQGASDRASESRMEQKRSSQRRAGAEELSGDKLTEASDGEERPAGTEAEASFGISGKDGDAAEIRNRYRRTSGKQALDRLSEDDEFTQLLFVVQKYMSKILTDREQQVFAYLYDGLHLPCDVLDFLVDYCVQQGKNNIRYIETVGLDWASSGIRDVKAAKKRAKEFDSMKAGREERSRRKQAMKGQSRDTDYDSIILDKVIKRKQS